MFPGARSAKACALLPAGRSAGSLPSPGVQRSAPPAGQLAAVIMARVGGLKARLPLRTWSACKSTRQTRTLASAAGISPSTTAARPAWKWWWKHPATVPNGFLSQPTRSRTRLACSPTPTLFSHKGGYTVCASDDPKSRGVLGQRAVRIPVFATEDTEFTEKGLGLKGGCISVNTALDLGLIEG